MAEYQTYRQIAIRYWERRRVVYNIALIPPTVLAYIFTAGLSYGGYDHAVGYVAVLLLLSAIGANICYSFAYALEFLFSGASTDSLWFRAGRPVAFMAGTLFAMVLSFVGGQNIAFMEYHYQLHDANPQ